jgi:hypothetical protein
MFSDVNLSGSFTTPSSGNAAQTLLLPFIPDKIEFWIQGSAAGNNWTSAANPGPVKYAFWQKGMADGTALCTANTAGAATDTSTFLATGGVTPVTSAANLYGPIVTSGGSSVSQAASAVVTITAHGFSTGDVVILEGTTGMLQVSGIPFSITVTGANTFTIPVNSAGFAAAATAASAKKLLFPYVFTPYISDITALTLGSSTTVSTAIPHGLSVGNTVRLMVPAPWGSTQISGQQGMVTSVPSATSFVVTINSSAASAFSFPTSAVAGAGVSMPQVIPFGDQASAFDLSALDSNFQGLIIGNSATAGSAILSANSALVLWTAQRSAKVYTSVSS